MEKQAFEILVRRKWGVVWYEDMQEYLIDSEDMDMEVAMASADQDPVNCILKAEEHQGKLEKQAQAG